MEIHRSVAPTKAIARSALVLVVAALLTVPSVAHAQESAGRARAHYQAGKDLFGSGDFKAAIAEFSAADNLAPSPILEFNIALCYEKLDDKPEAVRRYKSFLDKMPSAANKADVEAKIEKLEKQIEAERKAAAEAAKPPPDQPLDPELYAPLVVPPVVPPVSEPAVPKSTGDAELDRVAAIDVAAIRNERMGGGAAAAAAAPAGAGAPPAGAAPPGADPSGAAAGQTTPIPVPSDKGDDDPVYKKWWFWVVIGVSALILIDFASDDSGSSSNATRLTMPVVAPQTRAPDHAGGAVLLRF